MKLDYPFITDVYIGQLDAALKTCPDPDPGGHAGRNEARKFHKFPLPNGGKSLDLRTVAAAPRRGRRDWPEGDK
jgi:hypothetical protein